MQGIFLEKSLLNKKQFLLSFTLLIWRNVLETKPKEQWFWERYVATCPNLKRHSTQHSCNFVYSPHAWNSLEVFEAWMIILIFDGGGEGVITYVQCEQGRLSLSQVFCIYSCGTGGSVDIWCSSFVLNCCYAPKILLNIYRIILSKQV